MKQAISIFLLTITFLSQVGYQSIYLVQQMIIREEQKEIAFSMLPESSLEKMEDNDKIDWEEKGKEFYFHDNMYDVVKTKIIEGKKIYFVVNDNKESEVLKKFGNIIRAQQENNQNKKNNGLNIKFQQPDCTLNSLVEQVTFIVRSAKNQINNEKVKSFFICDILIPPPQC